MCLWDFSQNGTEQVLINSRITFFFPDLFVFFILMWEYYIDDSSNFSRHEKENGKVSAVKWCLKNKQNKKKQAYICEGLVDDMSGSYPKILIFPSLRLLLLDMENMRLVDYGFFLEAVCKRLKLFHNTCYSAAWYKSILGYQDVSNYVEQGAYRLKYGTETVPVPMNCWNSGNQNCMQGRLQKVCSWTVTKFLQQ